ncbi:MAG: ADP-ribosylation factor-like protein [Promethearchaeota archaeon]
MSDIKEQQKVLLMGLDNSGKTSIVLSLRENTNLLSYLSLKPTKGLNIESFETSNYELNIWDFGGQDQYREDYLNNFYKFTAAASKLIFVIDVQDMERYDIALSYLQSIISLLERDNNLMDISIFLHKFDPNLDRKERFKAINEIINKRLIDKIFEIIPLSFNYEIHRTCIYSVFEKSLIKKSSK